MGAWTEYGYWVPGFGLAEHTPPCSRSGSGLGGRFQADALLQADALRFSSRPCASSVLKSLSESSVVTFSPHSVHSLV